MFDWFWKDPVSNPPLEDSLIRVKFSTGQTNNLAFKTGKYVDCFVGAMGQYCYTGRYLWSSVVGWKPK